MHYNALHYITLHFTLNFTLHYSTLQCLTSLLNAPLQCNCTLWATSAHTNVLLLMFCTLNPTLYWICCCTHNTIALKFMQFCFVLCQFSFGKIFFFLLQTYIYTNAFVFHHSIVHSTVYIPEGDKALNKACRVMLDNALKWPPWQIGWPGPGSPRMQSDAKVLAMGQKKSFDMQFIYSQKYY